MKASPPRPLVAALTLVILGCTAEPTRPAGGAASGLQALQSAPASAPASEALAANAAFREWLRDYFAHDAASREKLVVRGEELARARRPLLAALLLHDPELALTLALTPTERASLPEAIARHLERWRDGLGKLHVLCAFAEDGANLTERFVTFHGQPEVLRAGVFGRRLGEKTLDDLRLHGVQLDGVIALTESPLRQVFSGEELTGLELKKPTSCPVDHKRSQESLVFHGADQLYSFCSPEHAESFAKSLATSEDIILDSAWTEGAKTVLFIRVDFSDHPGDPVTQAAAETLINTTVNTHYIAASFNKTTLSTTVTPTYRMARTQADYRTTDQYMQLMSDAYAAALAGGFNQANYSLAIVGFAATFTGGWAGRGYIGAKGIWLNGYFDLRVTGHELGHNYGLPHANFWNAGESVIGAGTNVEYGNPFDMMGSSGGMTSHFSAWFKRTLDWVVASEVLPVTTSGTYRVAALETAITTGYHGLKIRRDAQRDYWVEFRQLQTGNTMLMNGTPLFFGYGYNTGSHLLDMTPDDGTRANSPLVIGRTLSDPLAGVYITPVGKGGTTPESLDVVVNLGTFPANRPPTLSLSASATTVATNTSVVFTATATDPDGDPLAYSWEFDDGSLGFNSATQTKTLTAARVYDVRCFVTDMKGGTATAHVDVTVGTPTLFTLQGTVSAGGQPLGGARVSDGTRWTTTASDGTYTLSQVPAGSFTVTAYLFDYTFTRSFAAPLAVSGSMTGLDFTGTARPGYQVRGKVTAAGVALAGAVVTDGTRTATTNSTGDYVLSAVPNGRYTLTATAAGWQFSASGFTNPLEVNGGDVTTANFYATGQYLSGSISRTATTAPVVTDGVRSATATTCGSSWCWSLNSVPNGNWTLVATSPGFTITPANFTNPVTVAGAGRSNLNFNVVSGTTYLVSGTARTGTNPLPGVVVSDGTRSATTDSIGRYTLVGVPPGTWTLTPTLSGYTFVPATLSATVATTNLTGQDFNTTVVNAPPTIATPAAATPATTTSTSALTVLGADDGGEPALTYSWAATGSWPVTFSPNNSNAAKATTATFSGAGTYTLEVTVTDAGGLSVRSNVQVVVTQVLTTLAVSPTSANVTVGATQPFSATQQDQFGRVMFSGSPTWSVTGGGTIATNGTFTAAATPGGPFTVTASLGGLTATAIVTVISTGAPTIVTAATCTPSTVTGTTCALSVLATDNGGEPALTYTWSSPTGPAAVTFSVNGTNAAKASTATFQAAGAYQLVVTVRDAASNTIASSANVTVQATPTSITLTPTTLTLLTGDAQLFSATVLDQFGDAIAPQPSVTWSVSGGGAVDSVGLFTAGMTAGGPFTLTAHAGAITATAQITVDLSPDTTAPTVAITAPSSGAVLSGSATISVTANDAVGVTLVEYFADGTKLGETPATPYDFVLDTTTLSDGAHTLTAKARDAAGNSATSAAVPIVVSQPDSGITDGGSGGGTGGGSAGGTGGGAGGGSGGGGSPDTTPPTVRILTPEEAATVGLDVAFSVEATDDVGVTTVQLEVDGVRAATLTAGPWDTTVTVSEGSHSVVAIARDDAGNEARSTPTTFIASAATVTPPGLSPAVGSCGGCSGSAGAPFSLALALIGLLAVKRRSRVR